MSLYRNGISPTLAQTPFSPPLLQPLGYIVEASANHRRRELNSLKDLRRETHTYRGSERLFVLHNHDARVLEVLGIEGGTDKGGESWTWEYPNLTETQRLVFATVSLYSTEDNHWVLLIDPPPQERMPRYLPPRLKHQDATTRTSTLRTPSYHGQSSDRRSTTLDEDMCNALGGKEPLPEMLGELVFERWLNFLRSLSTQDCPWRKEEILYQALQSLEQNQDSVRVLTKKFRPLITPSNQDISDLLTRLHRHILLLPKPAVSSNTTPATSERALNRITYLGGLLLPITVVSSVLAIEGDYGPEGGNFWVFWVASAVASVIAVGLIHVDEVRGVEVWREVAEEFGILGGGEGTGGVRDGHGLVWERRTLGWGGAVKTVSGYYRVRGMKGLKFDKPNVA